MRINVDNQRENQRQYYYSLEGFIYGIFLISICLICEIYLIKDIALQNRI